MTSTATSPNNGPAITLLNAIVCRTYGTPEAVELSAVPSRPPGSGEVRIRVGAAGINFADVMAIAGVHQNTPPTPFTPGFEGAGVVVEAGAGVEELRNGDRVLFLVGHGAFAEEITTDEVHAVRLPPAMDVAVAAGFPVAWTTAYLALTARAHLRPGEWLLVHGAAGNIGGAALQIGKLLGAQTIATSRGIEETEQLIKLGADHVVAADTIAEGVHGAAPEGVDVIFDAVTGPGFLNTLGALAKGGRHIVAGAASGSTPEVSLIELVVRNCAFIGIDVDHYVHHHPELVRGALEVLLGWWRHGLLTLREQQLHPLSDAAAVLKAASEHTARSKAILLIPDRSSEKVLMSAKAH